MQQPFCITLYSYYILSEIQAREQDLQDLRDLNLASYFRIAQSKDGGKALQKLANRKMKSMQPQADLATSLAVGQAYLQKQKQEK